MNLRKYFVPMFQEPDVVAPEAPVVDPAIVADPPEPELQLETPPPEPRKKQMVPVEVVADLREKKRQQEARAEAAEARAAAAEALAERLQRGEKPADLIRPLTNPVDTSEEDLDRRAERIVATRDIRDVDSNGLAAYGATWADTTRALTAFGVNTPDFVMSVMEIDRSRAHEIMHEIAQDGEKAVALANMTPAKRIAEITRMQMAMAAKAETKVEPKVETLTPPKPKLVSKAPPPAPPVEPNTKTEVDWRSDKATDEEFTRGFNEMMKNKVARR